MTANSLHVRMGWDGQGGCSLQTAGRECGLTRERARQLIAPVLMMPRSHKSLHALERVLAFVRRHANSCAEELEVGLKAAGLTDNIFRLEGILKTADTLGRRAGFSIQQVRGERFVVTHSQIITSIVRMGESNVGRWGACTISDIRRQIIATEEVKLRKTFIRKVFLTRPDILWLDDANKWFWLKSIKKNRVIRRIDKILSVAPRVLVSEIYSAVYNDYYMRGHRIPKPVLLRLLQELPSCRLNGRYLELKANIEVARSLSAAEIVTRDLLHSHGGILDLNRLRDLCFASGISRSNFWRILSRSSVICRHSRGVYGLVGYPTPAK